MANIEELEAIVLPVIQKFKVGFDTMNEFNEWNSISDIKRNFHIIFNLGTDISMLVAEAATMMSEDITEEDVKNLIIKIIDDMIKLPFILDKVINLDGAIIAFIVDKVFEKFNWDKIQKVK